MMGFSDTCMVWYSFFIITATTRNDSEVKKASNPQPLAVFILQTPTKGTDIKQLQSGEPAILNYFNTWPCISSAARVPVELSADETTEVSDNGGLAVQTDPGVEGEPVPRPLTQVTRQQTLQHNT